MVVADERPYQHCAWTSRVHPWPVHQAARTDKDPAQMLDQIYGAEQSCSLSFTVVGVCEVRHYR